MSFFDADAPESAQDGTQGAQQPTPGGDSTPPVNTAPEPSQADLKGKPDWLPSNFWVKPAEEGGAADWQTMAKALAASVAEGSKKVTEQGQALARYTVPDSVAPYFEGIDKATLVSAHARSGIDEAQLDQMVAQMRSAGVGPGPAQAFMQSWVKSRHEATPEPKSTDALRDAAIAELNASGRPGSEMAQRIRQWGSGLVRESKWTAEQASAVEAVMHTPQGIEALHAILGQTAAPVGKTGAGSTTVNRSVLEGLRKRMQDPKFGTDAGFTAQLEADLERHRSLFEAEHAGRTEFTGGALAGGA